MSNKPLILSQNYFENTVLNPTFAVANASADDVPGREAFRTADNLRDMTSWTTAGQNAARRLYVDCLTNQTPTILILDRGHNLAGKNVRLAGYTDTTFATNIYGYSTTVPATPGGLGTDVAGCLTPDGVWWMWIASPGPARVWSVEPQALGAGIAPILTGVYLGVAYRFPEYFMAPAALDFGTNIKYLRNELSRGALRSKSRPLNFDKLPLNVHLDSGDYTGFDAEVRRLLRYNQPWWYCLDDSDAPGCSLMRLFQSSADMDYNPQVNPVHREIQLLLEEVLPTLYV